MRVKPSRIFTQGGLWKLTRKQLNFYRIHLLFFAFTPLIFSGIFYASNGEFHISYIDSLYNCVSAMTVCGLATVNLSSLTAWQQVILFLQMSFGSPVLVSWVMVYTRRHYFAKKFEHIVEAEMARRAVLKMESDADRTPTGRRGRVASLFRRRRHLSAVTEETDESVSERGGRSQRKVRPDMIHRVDDEPKLVNPSGTVTDKGAVPLKRSFSDGSNGVASGSVFTDQVMSSSPEQGDDLRGEPLQSYNESESGREVQRARGLSEPGVLIKTSGTLESHQVNNHETLHRPSQDEDPPSITRTETIEFVPNTTGASSAAPRQRLVSMSGGRDRVHVTEEDPKIMPSDDISEQHGTASRHSSLTKIPTSHTHRPAGKHADFGGFPMPHEILSRSFRYFFPKLERRLTRTLTIPATTTIDDSKPVPYISFDATVGRNSSFHMLTNEQLEELGGVEYRALNGLLWIVSAYYFGTQLIAYIVIAPYMSMSRWRTDFEPPMQYRYIPPAWYSLFQVVSAFTNTGMSLVDQSMVPFQTAYPTIFFIIFLILAGNTAFPIFLRFAIWILSKLMPKRSRTNEMLHFLLDHPRRCFIYLFPSHQTWFLLTVVLTLNFTDWFFFMVLDIGNPAIESIPLGTRFAVGLMQAVAVRAAGFGIVPLALLAPAVKVLYVVMMYVSVYPVAMSVRSTNVYEEQSLGVFEDDDGSEDEGDFQPTGPRVMVWSRYLAMHARKQLAFDMWWLALALFLVCIIERPNLDDPAKHSYFNIFTIIFELVSAYGTVGLSLGIPTQNYSLSGAFRPLSKLVVCLVMIRGRHRGLPVAIDRAVMLPAEFQKPKEDAKTETTHQQTANGDAVSEKIRRDDSSERRRAAARRQSSQEAYMEAARRKNAREDGKMSDSVPC